MPLTEPVLMGLVDAFADDFFKGNPAAVCLLPRGTEPRSGAWMQSMACEMNQPATSFMQPRLQEDGYDIRWFSVRNELEICGHGTLAATHFLMEMGKIQRGGCVCYYGRSVVLKARHDGTWIELDFPAKEVTAIETPAELEAIFGKQDVLFVGKNKLDLMIEVASEDALRGLLPRLDLLPAMDVRGAIVTAKGSGAFDFVSRCFFPRNGIPEDQVTGSAHCALAPYWAKKLGKRELLACQASARGGVLRLAVEPDRVRISGQAVLVWTGLMRD